MKLTHKLTNEDKAEICRIYVDELVGATILGRRFKVTARSICQVLKTAGVPRRGSSFYKGKNRLNVYKDGRFVDGAGYIHIHEPSHPRADANGYIREHIKVAWETFGPFSRDKNVHHKNHKKQDNRPENLELMTRAEHRRHHALEKIYVRQKCSLCGIPQSAHLLCPKHLHRYKKYGSPYKKWDQKTKTIVTVQS